MNTKKKIDMTKGSIMFNVVLFALPIILGNILQYLYTTVDTLVISRYCDHTSIAAVGTSSQPVEVILCVFLGIGTGVSILMSQHAGAKDEKRLSDTCKTSVSFVYLCGIPVSIIGCMLAPLLLKIMGVPDDVMKDALCYTRIVLCGAIGNIGYNMNAGILRGIGDSRASLYFLLVSCIINMVLDVLLVAYFGMGVSGVAVATSVAMFASWIFSIVYLKKKYPALGFTLFPRGIVKKELRRIIYIGLPIGLNNSLFSFGHVALQTLVNEQGSVFMAGWSISGRVTGIANMAITGLSSAATTYSGQNFGAGNIERLRQGQLRIPLFSGAITLGFGILFIFLRVPILSFFTDKADVLNIAATNVVIMLGCQWMYAVYNAIACILNGTGRVKYTTIVNLLMLWAVRVPSAYLIARFIDGRNIMYSFPISFAFGMISMLGYYMFSSSWRSLVGTVKKERIEECMA